MKSLRTLSRNRGVTSLAARRQGRLPRLWRGPRTGFTVIEVVLAIGILSILVGLGLVVSLDFYRQEVLRAERDNAAAILQRARNEAQNNVNQSSHGVYFGSEAYTIFQGDSYAARNPDFDENFPKSGGITVSGPSELVFDSLDAGSDVSGTVSFSNGVTSANIFVNYEGRIDW